MHIYHILWSRYDGKTMGWLVEAQSREKAIGYVRERFHKAANVVIKYSSTYCPPVGHVLFKWRAPDDWVHWDRGDVINKGS